MRNQPVTKNGKHFICRFMCLCSKNYSGEPFSLFIPEGQNCEMLDLAWMERCSFSSGSKELFSAVEIQNYFSCVSYNLCTACIKRIECTFHVPCLYIVCLTLKLPLLSNILIFFRALYSIYMNVMEMSNHQRAIMVYSETFTTLVSETDPHYTALTYAAISFLFSLKPFHCYTIVDGISINCRRACTFIMRVAV